MSNTQSICKNPSICNCTQNSPSLVAAVLEKSRVREGGEDEIVILPRCASCGEVITDFDDGVFIFSGSELTPSKQEVDGIPLSIISCNAPRFFL